MYYYYIPLCAVPWFFFTSVSDFEMMMKRKQIAMINYLMLVISSSMSLWYFKNEMCYLGIKIIRTVRFYTADDQCEKKYKELRLAIIPPSLLLLFDVSVWMKFLFDVKKKI